MVTPLLIVEEFLSAATCAVARAAYDANLAARHFRPRGSLTTDVAASLALGCLPFVVEDIGQRLREYFALPPLRPDYVAYTRAIVGGRHPLHADAMKLDGTPNHTPKRMASAMLYLSDGEKEFSGGVLRFPRLPQDVIPRAGLLVGFLTTLDYQHEVTPVTRGVRDAIALWFQ